METESKVGNEPMDTGEKLNPLEEIQKRALEKMLEIKKNKPKMLTASEIGPAQYHEWGTLNKIREKSPTLNNMIKTGIQYVTDHKGTFHKILYELELEYTIEDLPSTTASKKGVMYDIVSVPRWSFGDFSLTKEQAIMNAAKKGLNFLVIMSKTRSM